MSDTENVLLTNKHILLCLDMDDIDLEPMYQERFNYIKTHFCGQVILNQIIPMNYTDDTLIYACGNINLMQSQFQIKSTILVIQELSSNYGIYDHWLISIDEVPINIHNTGVYFQNLFEYGKDYFKAITNEHQFQSLTESNKPDMAFRKGLYLTHVEPIDDSLQFNLLRCSSNFSGPTENFKSTDHEIISEINGMSQHFFSNPAKVNHTLAQIYENHVIYDDAKGQHLEKKAKIKAHSDKTKDMPRNGLIVFCTFYQNEWHHFDEKSDPNIFTKLRFRLKPMVTDDNCQKLFDIVLYPNSVFMIPLSTNRLYTHEIVPSQCSISKIPIRMGYVIRCSKTQAVFKDHQTYLVDDQGKYLKLVDSTEEGVRNLKDIYLKENKTDELITYEQTLFSLNQGDYQQPIV